MSFRRTAATLTVVLGAFALTACSGGGSGVDTGELATAISSGTGAGEAAATCIATYLVDDSGISEDALKAVIDDPAVISSDGTDVFSESDLEILASEEYAASVEDCLSA
ncbi:hypothetical protein AB0N73_08955 [Microbacterium sp. NPDC089189]|uniref:hypothetical protein n=1 Tax=Microbacterium sp. NPDC089189 TaxID=3154972 RepID=UPI00343090B5